MLSRREFTRISALGLASAAGVFTLAGCSDAAPSARGQDAREQDVRDVMDLISSVSASDDGKLTISFFAFDTPVNIQAYGVDEHVMQELKSRCEYFDNTLSRQREGSDIDRINRAGGAPVQVRPETAELITLSLGYCEASGGLFDITIGAATLLWDFNEGVMADADELAEAVKHIDWRGVTVEGDTVMLADPLAKLDVGGIAKGFIADDLASMLEAAGCTGAFINLGGNVYVLGTKPDGSAWNIGLQDPNKPDGAVFGKVVGSDCSVVTSGLYERFFEADGVRYHHILDPRTGYPAQTDLVSSTIRSDRSLDGDAYSTILFLQGSTAALETVEATPLIEALLMDAEGQTVASEGFVWEALS